METGILARHPAVRSGHVDEVRTKVAEAFCAHRLLLAPGERHLDARLNSASIGQVGLHYLEYGASVRITPVELENFFLVQIPVRGSATIRSGSHEFVSDRRRASVPDPDAALDMHWGRDNAQLIVWMDRGAVERTLRQMLGGDPEMPLRLDPEMDLTTPWARAWLEVVHFLAKDLDGAGLSIASEITRHHMAGLLISQMLASHGHSLREHFEGPASHAAPKAIRRAQELFEQHASEPLTIPDVAEAVGLSVRSLQDGFRRYLDTTPSQFLRQARLARAHALLSEQDPSTTSVADVASACGFAHLGRFATDYRQRYGTAPSVTLRG